MNAPLNWVIKHWRGGYSLAVSFWINLVALRLALFLLQEWLTPDDGADWSHRPWVFIAWAFFAHMVVFIWQAVGVLRSAEQHHRLTGSQASSWGAQLALVPALFLNGTYLLQAWQQAQPVAIEDNILEVMERERAKKYKLKIIPQLMAIELTGQIELGISKKLNAMIEQGFPARMLILESHGGNIYEARAIARVLRERNMNSHVSRLCSSACTAAYIGGTRRTMAADARIGFHQYAIEGRVSIVNVDPRKEQEKDRELFKAQGVSGDFLKKMFDAPSNDMWFPQSGELLEAGVAHEVLGES